MIDIVVYYKLPPKKFHVNWYRLQYQRMCYNKIATNIVFATYIMTASETLHK